MQKEGQGKTWFIALVANGIDNAVCGGFEDAIAQSLKHVPDIDDQGVIGQFELIQLVEDAPINKVIKLMSS